MYMQEYMERWEKTGEDKTFKGRYIVVAFYISFLMYVPLKNMSLLQDMPSARTDKKPLYSEVQDINIYSIT